MLLQAIELNPDNDMFQVTLGTCLIHKSEFQKAEVILRDVLSRYPNSVRVLHRYAMCCRGLRDPENSIKYLTQVEISKK